MTGCVMTGCLMTGRLITAGCHLCPFQNCVPAGQQQDSRASRQGPRVENRFSEHAEVRALAARGSAHGHVRDVPAAGLVDTSRLWLAAAAWTVRRNCSVGMLCLLAADAHPAPTLQFPQKVRSTEGTHLLLTPHLNHCAFQCGLRTAGHARGWSVKATANSSRPLLPA